MSRFFWAYGNHIGMWIRRCAVVFQNIHKEIICIYLSHFPTQADAVLKEVCCGNPRHLYVPMCQSHLKTIRSSPDKRLLPSWACNGQILHSFLLAQVPADFQETFAFVATFEASVPLTNLVQAIDSEVTSEKKLSNGVRMIQLHFCKEKNYPQNQSVVLNLCFFNIFTLILHSVEPVISNILKLL